MKQSRGRAAVVNDTRDGSVIRNNYDQSDRPAESEQRDGNGGLKYRTLIEYDDKSRIKAFNEATASANHRTGYTYDADNRTTKVLYNNNDNTKITYTYDKLNRITKRIIKNGDGEYKTEYAYVQGAAVYGAGATTPLIQSITQGSGANALNFSYTYDSRGNITSETRNGVTTTYEYDALGQLTRVNDPNDPTAYNEGGLSNNGTTWIYAYDRGGNILSKTAYEFTTGTVGTAVRTWLYEYNDTNWKDKLTKFDGNTITYDAIGNPLSDGTWTYVWQAGRQLKSMSKAEGNDTITMEFTYNHAGLRTKKVKKVNGVTAETTEYILNGKNVVELVHTNHDTTEVNKLLFYYDAQGRVALVDFNGTLYSYAHNLQGDIIGILDSSGNIVVEYKYDAWGKPISVTGTLITTLGEMNPFRYRGYTWDQETEFCYLINRNYNCIKSRFINLDAYVDQKNIFAYSCNNPVNMVDSSGYAPQRFDIILHYNYTDSSQGQFHAVFEVANIVFSFGHGKSDKSGGRWKVGSIEDYRGEYDYDKTITLHDVPRDMVLNMFEVFDSKFPNPPDWSYKERMASKDPYAEFSKSFGLWNTWYLPYDYETNPCIAAMYEAIKPLGINIDALVGPVKHDRKNGILGKDFFADSDYYDPETYYKLFFGGNDNIDIYYTEEGWMRN